MKKYIQFIVPLLAVLFSVSSASAQFSSRDRDDDRWEDRRYEDSRYGNNRYGNNWTTIDRTRVSNRDNYERINVNRRNGDVRQLLFKTDGAVNIRKVTVRYSNGRTQDLRVRNVRSDNRRSNTWDNDVMVTIPSNGRSEVREIRYWFDSRNSRSFSRPTITVYGR